MKKVAIVLLALLCALCLFTACNDSESFTLTSTANSYTFTVGQSVDFKSFFTLTDDKTGENIPITDDMIDASNADLSKVGEFFVTCSYQDVTKTVLVSVRAEGALPPSGGDTNPPSGGDTNPPSAGTSVGVVDLTKAENLKGTPSGQQIAYEKDGISIAVDKASAQNALRPQDPQDGYPVRIYAGSTLTVKYPSMTKIVITCTDKRYEDTSYEMGFDGMEIAGATITREGLVITIVFDTPTNEFVSAGLSMQTRVVSVEVFANGATNPPSGGDTNPPSGGSGDVTPPSGGDTNPPSGGDTNPPSVTHAGTENDPYTVADALAVLDGMANGTNSDIVYVKAILVEIGEVKTTYLKELKIADTSTGNTLSIYSADPMNDADMSVEVGDTILVKGGLRVSADGSVRDMGTVNGQYVLFGIVDEGGSTPPSGGESGDVTLNGTITTTFTSNKLVNQALQCAEGGLKFTTQNTVNNFDTNRGVQFMQQNGAVTLTGPSLTNVATVSVVVATNCAGGMSVGAKIGETALTSNGQATVGVEQQAQGQWMVLTTVTFTSSTPLSGEVIVNLFPSATAPSNSMWISQIIVSNQVTGEAPDQGGGGEVTPPSGGDTNPPSEDTTVDLTDVFAKYDSYDEWNFDVEFDFDSTNNSWDRYGLYSYNGDNCKYLYDWESNSYVDYILNIFGNFSWYEDNGDGTHTLLTETDFEYDFINCYNYFDLSYLGEVSFKAEGDHYTAINAQTAGENVFGAYEDGAYTYTDFDIYVDANNNLVKIVATGNDGTYTDSYSVEFSNHGNVDEIDVSDLDLTNGAGEAPDQGGSSTTANITTTFTDSTGKTLSCNQAGMEFVASRSVDGWDNDRGLQFLKSNGAVTITSENSIENVTTITLDVSSNKASYSTTVTVTVGGVALTCSSSNVITNTSASLTFTSNMSLDGVISITLTPSTTTGSSLGSMYILTVIVSGSDSGTVSKEMMPSQAGYTYDDTRFHDKEEAYYEKTDYQHVSGLKSTGSYSALVVPVEFSDDKFVGNELANLEIVFNGTKEQTGWHSVNSYYKEASYGKLDITFDITAPVTLSNSYSYYETDKDGYNILEEVAGKIVLNAGQNIADYDVDKDGCLDAVYFVYSAPIEGWESLYWAFVYQYDGEAQIADYDFYNYFFASVDFATENVTSTSQMKLNATTFVHETGHLLGLDDYYDYGPGIGSDMGVGGADMMDNTVGDHNPYSKIMLGWVTPTIIASPADIPANGITLTANSVTPNGENVAYNAGTVLLLPLDYDGTYFSEYLLIELYVNTGLNSLHSADLYDGEEFGVRIYHVSSSCDNPYSYVAGLDDRDQYYSFTDNNNSITEIPLIKLIEADGDSNFQSNYDGDADADDLWQANDVFSSLQPNYSRNDGKLVNFDISFDSVTAGGATVTITFLTAE